MLFKVVVNGCACMLHGCDHAESSWFKPLLEDIESYTKQGGTGLLWVKDLIMAYQSEMISTAFIYTFEKDAEEKHEKTCKGGVLSGTFLYEVQCKQLSIFQSIDSRTKTT